MLQGSGGQTGFVNIEAQGGRLTLKFQAVGLNRGANDAHGHILSVKRRASLDCGRLRVDSHGQGGLLRVWQPDELNEMNIDDFDSVAVTVGGVIVLAGSLTAGRVDWESIRSVIGRSTGAARLAQQSVIDRMQPNPNPIDTLKERTAVAAKVQAGAIDIDKLVASLSNQPQETIDAIVNALTNRCKTSGSVCSPAMEPMVIIASGSNTPDPKKRVDPDNRSRRDARIDPIFHTLADDPVQPDEPLAHPFLHTPPPATPAFASNDGEVWPVWSAYRKPALLWPDEARDLCELFERGEPDESVKLPGWLFVKTPSAMEEFDSLLGVYAQDGRVLQTACLIKGADASEPPAGLNGYVYNGDLADGCWARWRDYTEVYAGVGR